MALSPGSRLRHYEILAAIGAGGMGEVYRARDTSLGRDVAIKILPGASTPSSDQLTRFERSVNDIIPELATAGLVVIGICVAATILPLRLAHRRIETMEW